MTLFFKRPYPSPRTATLYPNLDLGRTPAASELVFDDEKPKLQGGPLPSVESIIRTGSYAASLAQIGDGMKSFDVKHRTQYFQALLIIYALAEHLRSSEDARLDFCRADAWKRTPRSRPRHDQLDTLLKHALRLANGLETDAGAKRASKQSRALTPLFIAGLPGVEVRKRLTQAGGVEALARANAVPRAAGTTAPKRVRLEISSGPKSECLLSSNAGAMLKLQFIVTAVKGRSIHADLKHVFKS